MLPMTILTFYIVEFKKVFADAGGELKLTDKKTKELALPVFYCLANINP